MVDVAPGWSMEVERGPDWLFVRLSHLETGTRVSQLAEQLWRLLDQHLTYRLVLELDQLALMRSELLGQLVLLHKRVTAHGGLMRLCGLSPGNQLVLAMSRLDTRFPPYRDRGEAVTGYRPLQPR